jgi:hypothetical protein
MVKHARLWRGSTRGLKFNQRSFAFFIYLNKSYTSQRRCKNIAEVQITGGDRKQICLRLINSLLVGEKSINGRFKQFEQQ